MEPVIMERAGQKLVKPDGRAAFSLIELLVVLTVMAILIAGAFPAMQSLLESSNLTQGGQILVDQISVARQIASSRNCTVQVRLVKLPTVPTGGYGAIQLWGTPSGCPTNAAGIPIPIPMSRMVNLPQSVVVSQDTTNYSQLLANAATGTMTLPTSAAPGSYAAFSIRPSGLVQVSATETAAESSGTTTSSATAMAGLYLTVVPARFGNNASITAGPKNYVTVQLNPATGTALVFRP